MRSRSGARARRRRSGRLASTGLAALLAVAALARPANMPLDLRVSGHTSPVHAPGAARH